MHNFNAQLFNRQVYINKFNIGSFGLLIKKIAFR